MIENIEMVNNIISNNINLNWNRILLIFGNKNQRIEKVLVKYVDKNNNNKKKKTKSTQ